MQGLPKGLPAASDLDLDVAEAVRSRDQGVSNSHEASSSRPVVLVPDAPSGFTGAPLGVRLRPLLDLFGLIRVQDLPEGLSADSELL